MGEASIELMSKAYPQLEEKRDIILNELAQEEARFLETLERGEKLLSDILKSENQQISGEQAFELYDTYGFPLELTQEITQEHGRTVDVAGFEVAMKAQRQRAKEAIVTIDPTLRSTIEGIAESIKPTLFFGYEVLDRSCQVVALIVKDELVQEASTGDVVKVILDGTPFYGESGGQVGDRGMLLGSETEKTSLIVIIENVSRNQGLFIHSGRIKKGTLRIGDLVIAKVDTHLRRRAQAHHTATHLLQSALKQLVDASISQAGSLVDFDRLRFDFSYPGAISLEKLEKIENLINDWINEIHRVEVTEMKLEQAKVNGAIAMFGEKYGAYVRVVNIPNVSMELCGGTHVSNTGEIGLFKIISETGVASGIRRIEAIAGTAVLPYLNDRDRLVKELGDHFKAPPSEVMVRVIALQDELKTTNKALLTARSELISAKSAILASQVELVGDFQILVSSFTGVQAALLSTAAKQLQEQLGDNTAVLLGSILEEGKVSFVAAFGKDVVQRGLNAGKVVNHIAKLCGGGGGGRANLAQAGGRNLKSFESALKIAKSELVSLLIESPL
eukprot:gb/GEZN01001813.1/.p1 GENE.gb/GEZN01001813.1/~~gb/GEZN01001813.1/.p1  ORF type:complete len:560 (+),score=20.02 gb/GEZN01001813.1/:323-2002(+)